jgi:hypothetical protein
MSNFAFIPLEVIQDNRLTKRHIKVLIALFSYRGKNTDTVWPSREKLSKRCGMPITRVSEVTGQLVDLGWLVKKGKGGFSKSTRYTITVPDLVTVTKTVTVTDLDSNGYQNGNSQACYQNGNGQRTNQELKEELKGGNKRFKPPTIDEVSMYCIERGNSINAEAFVDYYLGVGWKVGKTLKPMKCWKSSIRTWERQDKEKNRGSHVHAATLAVQGINIDTNASFDNGLGQIAGLLN